MLKLSAFFDIPQGFQHAIAELTWLLPVDSLMLQLSHMYWVDQWVQPAFRQLLSCSLASITHVEAQWMGLDFFYILSHTKAVIEENHCAVAYTELRLVQFNACTTHSQCTAIWEEEWWNRVAQQILHPDTPCYGEELLTLLEDADCWMACLVMY